MITVQETKKKKIRVLVVEIYVNSISLNDELVKRGFAVYGKYEIWSDKLKD
jgi:endonuclease YncB( thermonuclease family)